MAKSNFLAMMKAKPNARGKRSHLPLECGVKDCHEETIVSHCDVFPPKRYCIGHSEIFTPKKVTEASARKELINQLNRVLALG